MDSFAGMYRGASSLRNVNGPRIFPWECVVSCCVAVRLETGASYQAETHQEYGVHGDFLRVAALVRRGERVGAGEE